MIGTHDVVTGQTTGLLARCKEDPTNLALMRELRERVGDAYMEGMALAAKSSQEGGDYSLTEIAQMSGLKNRQTVSDNAAKGRKLFDEAREKLGVVALRK